VRRSRNQFAKRGHKVRAAESGLIEFVERLIRDSNGVITVGEALDLAEACSLSPEEVAIVGEAIKATLEDLGVRHDGHE